MLVDRNKNTFAVKSRIFVIMHFKCTCTYTYNVHIHGLYCISIKIYMANMENTYMNIHMYPKQWSSIFLL